MWYLDRSRYSVLDSPRYRLYIASALDRDVASELAAFVGERLLGAIKKRNFVSERFGARRYFCKVQPVKNLGHRFKTCLGIRRRGCYPRPVAEVANYLLLRDRPYLPALAGFGYRKGAFGLIDGAAVVTEHIDAAPSVLQLIQGRPERLETALEASFDLIGTHLRDGFVHLDLWAGNILLSDDLSRSWLIDLEYCRLDPRARFAQRMGACCAYFYRHTLAAYVSEADYLALLHRRLRASGAVAGDVVEDAVACAATGLSVGARRHKRRLATLY